MEVKMTALVVQKDLIVENYQAIKRFTGVTVIAMLKGNAYGMGDVEIARLLWEAGARIFAVSRIEEALCLHNAMPEAEILLLSPYSNIEDAERIVESGITASVGSYDSAVLLNGIAEEHNVRCRVHLKFDTGMGRFGFLPEDADKAVKAAKYLPNLEICGCFSHLSNCFGKNKKSVFKQLELFNSCVSALKEAQINPGICHIANSNAALLYKELRLDAVRAGSALVGRVGVKDKAGLKKVGYLQSSICETRWLPAGHNIGYANTFKTKHPMRIAIIPVGYADGIFTEKVKDTFRFRDVLRFCWHDFKMLFGGGRLYCTIGGKKVPLLGITGLCSVIADVSSVECKEGDIVLFDVNPIFVNSNVQRQYV
jgi:alanine racemase